MNDIWSPSPIRRAGAVSDILNGVPLISAAARWGVPPRDLQRWADEARADCLTTLLPRVSDDGRT